MSEGTVTPPKPEAKPAVSTAVAAETARCRKVVLECVATAKKRVQSGTFPADVCGALAREILNQIGGE